MNREDAHRYRNWGHSLWHNDTMRLMTQIKDVVEADERMKDKMAIHSIIATEFPKEIDDIMAFRDSYLQSEDDNHYWAGVALNNALTKLYLADFGDEVEEPTAQENEAMSKYIWNVRKTEATKDAVSDVYVTPGTLEAKSKELRGKPSKAVTGEASATGEPKAIEDTPSGVEESKSS